MYLLIDCNWTIYYIEQSSQHAYIIMHIKKNYSFIHEIMSEIHITCWFQIIIRFTISDIYTKPYVPKLLPT